jgi:hypothetical protein
VAALFPDGTVDTKCVADHAVGVVGNYHGEHYIYYFGSAWARYDVRTAEEWEARIRWFLRSVRQPLKPILNY